MGRSRGGWSSKLHVLCDGAGRPLELIVTAGQRHECPRAVPLLEAGWARLEPEAVLGDSGYSSVDLRAWIVAHGAEPVIPRKRHEHIQGDWDGERYRERNRVERLFNRLKRFRAVATRMEKRAASYHTMVTIACILEWL